MKIPPLIFRKPKDLEDVFSQLAPVFQQLMTALRTLSFEENFAVFKWEGSIATATEQRIPHPLGRIPTGRLIVRQRGGVIEDGSTPWDSGAVFLKNTGGTDSEVTVIFYL